MNFTYSSMADKAINRLDRLAPEWCCQKKLKAISIMRGEGEWQQFAFYIEHNSGVYVFDQDMKSDEERQTRWLEVAKNLKATLGMCLPHALEIVRTVRPSSDPKRPMSSWYEPNRIFDEGLQEEKDLWWVRKTELGHPLCPEGGMLGEAINVAEMARVRCGEALIRTDRLCVVVTPDRMEHKYTHTYFTRGELQEISPVPPADVLKAPQRFSLFLKDFFHEEYPDLESGRCEQMLRGWCESARGR